MSHNLLFYEVIKDKFITLYARGIVFAILQLSSQPWGWVTKFKSCQSGDSQHE